MRRGRCSGDGGCGIGRRGRGEVGGRALPPTVRPEPVEGQIATTDMVRGEGLRQAQGKRYKGVMTEDEEVVRGSGNLFADLGMPDADMRQLGASLAAEIIKALATGKLSTRAAEKLTGIAAADFSRIRGAKLTGFTGDRLMAILHKLNREVQVTMLPVNRGAAAAVRR